MLFDGLRLILGSRSPRRLELLRLLVPAEAIEVVPPRSAEEPGFDGLNDWDSIACHLADIARAKCDDVLDQVRQRGVSGPSRAAASASRCAVPPIVITADTTIVVHENGDRLLVLGQPPANDTWRETVRGWFRDHYSNRTSRNRTHTAVTAVCVAGLDGRREERVVRTEVTFVAEAEKWLDWYLSTGEPRGKAGGYALQGAGSLFVERLEGSPSNVIGLPLREVAEMLREVAG
jgi:septum formation protein